MKYLLITLSLALGSITAFAQNTFPTNGNVGVGTTAPSENLDVSGTFRSNRIRTGSAVFKPSSVSSFNSFNTGSYSSLTAGWIAADFGGSDNGSDRLVVGTGFGGKVIIGSHNASLTDWGGALLIAPIGGNVGIGLTNPSFKLDVGGTGNFSDKAWFGYGNPIMSGYSWVNAALTTNSIEIVNSNSVNGNLSPTLAFHTHGAGGPQFRLASDGSKVLYLESAGENSARSPLAYGGGPNSYFSRLHIDGSLTLKGNIGIGTDNPDARLSVNGLIHAKEVKVDLSFPAPDYVFDENYSLKSLAETELYINANKHLPDVPSAATMAREGVNLSEMNMLLLKKVEELTLHLIARDKSDKELRARIDQLEAKLR